MTHRCANSDVEAALKLAKEVIKGVSNVPLPAMPQNGEAKITGYGERIVDARTMFILSEKLKRIMYFPVEVPGQGKIIYTRSESKEYQFNITKKGR